MKDELPSVDTSDVGFGVLFSDVCNDESIVRAAPMCEVAGECSDRENVVATLDKSGLTGVPKSKSKRLRKSLNKV